MVELKGGWNADPGAQAEKEAGSEELLGSGSRYRPLAPVATFWTAFRVRRCRR